MRSVVLVFALVPLLASCALLEAESPEPPFVCGDGLAENHYNGDEEECDDGNRVSGDGCNAWCEDEPRIVARWYPVSPTGTLSPCHAADDVVEVHVDAELPDDVSYLEMPLCSAFQFAFNVHETTFVVSMRVRDAGGAVYAESVPTRHYISQPTPIEHRIVIP